MGRVALALLSVIKLDITILVERPNGSSWMAGCGGLAMTFGGRGRITTSSRSSLDTPLDDSDDARSGGDVEHSVDSERGVSSSWGTPESARRKQRGVVIVLEIVCKLNEGNRV